MGIPSIGFVETQNGDITKISCTEEYYQGDIIGIISSDNELEFIVQRFTRWNPEEKAITQTIQEKSLAAARKTFRQLVEINTNRRARISKGY